MSEIPLIVSVSGIRGVVGASLTPQVVTDFAACFGTPLAGQTVIVSRDGRHSGAMYRDAAVAGLLAVGCRVVDVGIAATPTCGFLVKHLTAAGAMQITASHNPPEWNGLKLFRPEGYVVSPKTGEEIAQAFRERRAKLVGHSEIMDASTMADPLAPHLERVLSLVDVSAIRRRRFRVVFDANHAAGAVFGPRLLQALACDHRIMGGVADGQFKHPPEPLEANLVGLCRAVTQAGADVGFAVDPDADRLAIVDDRGRYIGEEYTLALAIRHRVARQAGPVVINSSTSRLSEEVARAARCPVYRTNVGEVHVAERMVRENAVIGGEGNGGVIEPRVGLVRDSLAGVALVLDLLAQSAMPLSSLVDSLPRYAIHKDKIPLARDRLAPLLERLAEEFGDGQVDRSDGLRVDWQDAWVQVRGSNTEPIVRIIAEARDRARAEALCQLVHKLAESV